MAAKLAVQRAEYWAGWKEFHLAEQKVDWKVALKAVKKAVKKAVVLVGLLAV